jgi:indolepyruvate ferredoxin oxidoreductase alpha subunit
MDTAPDTVTGSLMDTATRSATRAETETAILLGNEAIALGLVENGCRVVTAYPGTPSSEILAGVVRFTRDYGRKVYTEWSTNEKVAFEVALAAAWSGLRAAVAMKQVGLNVASDPLFSAAYTGVKGGFLVIPADDPGPLSSQTEQDSRLIALAAKVPVFDPATPAEARAMVADALALSERHELPVILRPTTRVCHAVQDLDLGGVAHGDAGPPRTRFNKEPARWAATPRARYQLHLALNRKLAAVAEEFERSRFNTVSDAEAGGPLGIIAAGAVAETARQALVELGVRAPLLKIGTPFPLPQGLVRRFVAQFETVVVLEEPGACIELQLGDRRHVRGRLDGAVPAAGELTPDVVGAVLAEALAAAGVAVAARPDDAGLQAAVAGLDLPVRRPRLCPGCGHRSAFFALKQEFGPRSLYPSDIGCYTLGINLRAVDTCIDMGAAVSMADGLEKAARLTGDTRPILATIGDSTFLHAGIPPLINAVHTGSRFVLVILDNTTTAMTGFQPTAANARLADGAAAARQVVLADLVRACGVGHVAESDPYDQAAFRRMLRAAHAYTREPDGGVAVVIARRPCVLYDRLPLQEHPVPVLITEECDGCRFCLEAFECPALVLRADGSRVDLDERLCVDCGQCIDACYKGFIVARG